MKHRPLALICAGVTVALALVFGMGSACDSSSQDQDRKAAARKAENRHVYQPTHNVDFNNYDLRLRMADDPTTILWCTFAWPQAGLGLVTVPIAGKLTDSGITPFPPDSNRTSDFTPDPDPNGMYGTSAEFRYGFDPTRTQYHEFTLMPSYCTNVPTKYQQAKTTIIVEAAPTLVSLTRAAEQALRSGDADKALSILQGAESK